MKKKIALLLVAFAVLLAGGMVLNSPGVDDPTTDVPGIDPDEAGDAPRDSNDNA